MKTSKEQKQPSKEPQQSDEERRDPDKEVQEPSKEQEETSNDQEETVLDPRPTSISNLPKEGLEITTLADHDEAQARRILAERRRRSPESKPTIVRLAPPTGDAHWFVFHSGLTRVVHHEQPGAAATGEDEQRGAMSGASVALTGHPSTMWGAHFALTGSSLHGKDARVGVSGASVVCVLKVAAVTRGVD